MARANQLQPGLQFVADCVFAESATMTVRTTCAWLAIAQPQAQQTDFCTQ